ncbi:MAG: gliding motility-associated protein GldE [Lentimicrobiaceae bacterium]|nr:gliding motility-associated protein GldE [Lentimicrobiaceae bacterium]
MADPDIEPPLQLLAIAAGIFTGPVTFGIITALIIMLLLLVASAAISGSEIAFFSLGPTQLNDLLIQRKAKAQLIQVLLEKPKRLLATILIANNFVNVAIVILSSYIMMGLFNFDEYPLIGFLVQVVIVTSLILMFGEIMPKIYATQHASRMACFMVGSLFVLRRIFYPLSSILVSSTNIIDKRIARKGHNITINDLSEALDLTSGNIQSPEEEKKILKGIVKFGDITVREIMRARIDVTAVDEETTFSELIPIIVEAGFSRIPVFKDSFDQVTGILYIKDLLPHLNKEDDFEWQKLPRPAFFVPENKGLSDLLKEFQSRKIHMAIVVDEYGGTSGLVTFEDVIEEIVGEINDEFDSEADESLYIKLDDNNYIFEGKTLLNDFCKILNIQDRIFADAKGDSDTLAGLMLELAGKIPVINEEIEFEHFIFKAETVDKRRIKKVKVSLKA